ncbi:MAG: DUF1810 domain-containing protein [Bacteroidota bacterium]
MENHNLERFIAAQKATFQDAITEIRAGKKTSHWMWFIFPQIQGLGFTEYSKFYAITDLSEAKEYLEHRVLGPRLVLIASELLKLATRDPYMVFGSPDDLKLHSSITLFAEVPGSDPVFAQVLKEYFNGLRDNKTLKVLALLNNGQPNQF